MGWTKTKEAIRQETSMECVFENGGIAVIWHLRNLDDHISFKDQVYSIIELLQDLDPDDCKFKIIIEQEEMKTAIKDNMMIIHEDSSIKRFSIGFHLCSSTERRKDQAIKGK